MPCYSDHDHDVEVKGACEMCGDTERDFKFVCDAIDREVISLDVIVDGMTHGHYVLAGFAQCPGKLKKVALHG